MKYSSLFFLLIIFNSCKIELKSTSQINDEIKEQKIQKTSTIGKNDEQFISPGKSYLLSKEKVTNDEYYQFLLAFGEIFTIDSAKSLLPFKSNEHNLKFFKNGEGNLPVSNLSRFKASTYCYWLTQRLCFDVLVKEGLLSLSNINEDYGQCIKTFEDWAKTGSRVEDFENDKASYPSIASSKTIYGPNLYLPPFGTQLSDTMVTKEWDSVNYVFPECELFDVKFPQHPIEMDTVNCGFKICYAPQSKVLIHQTYSPR